MKGDDDGAISDLHTVNEEEYGEENCVDTKQDYREHAQHYIETEVIMKEIREHYRKVQRVKETLLTWIHRRRFLKMRVASVTVQKFTKGWYAFKYFR